VPERNDFHEALAWGQEGEHLVAGWLMSRGVAAVPLYQFKNHNAAPFIVWQASGKDVCRILPDLTCWKDGRCFFAESKRKEQWVSYPRAGRGLETGFDWKHFEHYTEVAERCGCHVWIFFLHETEDPTGLYCGRLDQMTPLVRHWDGYAPGRRYITDPLALFPLSILRRVASLDEVLTPGEAANSDVEGAA
jgi:hypothetical protein